jgi:hypothetical protein
MGIVATFPEHKQKTLPKKSYIALLNAGGEYIQINFYIFLILIKN